ncbi:MAG: potassium-transporting ATPase subunit KdpC [Phascolarctobacterium sp.]
MFIKPLRAILVMTIFCGLLYPLVMTGLGQILFPFQANGSIIERDGKVIGSALIGQEFKSDKYFSSRPSANEYNAADSAGTNYGAINKELKKQVEERAAAVRTKYGLLAIEKVPSDMVTNDAAGFDPHLSPQAIRLQVNRVAEARHMDKSVILKLVEENTEYPSLGFIGEARVNVLKLNLALDKAQS